MPIRTYILENELLRVEVVPARGGRITSLRSVRTGQEFLLSSFREPIDHPITMPFSEGHIGGFDECLPSVSECDAVGAESSVPDHGDLWRKSWDVESDKEGLLLQVDAVSRPLRLTRRATLNGDTLNLAYELFNTSASPATWLWCAHPLLQAETGDRIVLPQETAKVTVEYISDSCFVRRSDIPWPVACGEFDLSLLREEGKAMAYKLFAQAGYAGKAILYRSHIKQGIAVHFDRAKLPFLGVWVNAGAWPESNPDRRFTVALEPATCAYDSLGEAERHGAANCLAGGARKSWLISLQLLGARRSCALNDLDI